MAVVVMAGMAIMSGAVPTAAKDGDVIRRGDCTMGTDWKLKLSPEDGRIEVELEVDQNQNGVTWNVRLKHDGTRIWRGSRTTRPPSGSFTVHKRTNDRAGSDTVVARASNPKSGEVCRGVATF